MQTELQLSSHWSASVSTSELLNVLLHLVGVNLCIYLYSGCARSAKLVRSQRAIRSKQGVGQTQPNIIKVLFPERLVSVWKLRLPSACLHSQNMTGALRATRKPRMRDTVRSLSLLVWTMKYDVCRCTTDCFCSWIQNRQVMGPQCRWIRLSCNLW